jgi:hypothetical protein
MIRTGRVCGVAVATEAQLDLGPRQFRRHAVDDARDRPTGALVDEVLGVERGQHLGVDRVEHRADRVARAEAGVDPALERDDEDRFVEVGVREENYVVVDFVVHHFPSNVIFALCASVKICVGYSVTLP